MIFTLIDHWVVYIAILGVMQVCTHWACSYIIAVTMVAFDGFVMMGIKAESPETQAPPMGNDYCSRTFWRII